MKKEWNYFWRNLRMTVEITMLVALLLVPGASASVFYKFDVIGMTGQANITSMGSPSINDKGTVAFIGSLTSGLYDQTIFVGNGSGLPRNIRSQTPRRFTGLGNINNDGKVAASYMVPGNPPYTFVYVYDSNGGSNTLIAKGGNKNPPFNADFNAVGTPTMNNNGQVAFWALNGAVTMLVTGVTPNFNEAPIGSFPPIRPMIADNGHVIVLGGNFNDKILLYDYDLKNSINIADTSMGFTQLGRSPGISDDGNAVAFAGFAGDPGIFAGFNRSGLFHIIPIAGNGAWDVVNKKCINPELGNDSAGNPLCFNSFNIDSRVAVIHQQFGTNETVVVSFIATPNAISSDKLFSDKQGIWTVRIDENQSGVFNISKPLPVVQIGDTVDGRTITDLQVNDQIANAATDDRGNIRTQRRGDHRIAFWASTDKGDMVVRASHLQNDWVRVSNSPKETWELRQTPGNDGIVRKVVPNDWILKIVSNTDENGQTVEKDGYIWWKVEDQDPSDGVIGWMAAATSDGSQKYLLEDNIDESKIKNLDTRSKRVDEIVRAVDHYYNNIDTEPSLYSSNDIIGFNHLSIFKEIGFPQELILAIAAQESGIHEICDNVNGCYYVDFNNEFVTFDYGHGIMQVTFQAWSHEPNNYSQNNWDNRGKGSGVSIPLCKSIKSNEYVKCYENAGTKNKLLKPYKHYEDDPSNPIFKQYTNQNQSIYANIKDGMEDLRSKYRSKCPKNNIIIDNLVFSCNDIERILMVWGYNGITTDINNNYLRNVSNKLDNLNNYFPGVTYSDTDQLIEKLRVANDHRQTIKAYSPIQIRVLDSNGNTTGLIGNNVTEEIPNSMYDSDNEAATIFFPNGSYIYNAVGTENGTYGLSIDFSNNGTYTMFNATDIPISNQEIHKYTIDWDALSRGGKGVTIQIDADGDGIFEKTITVGNNLSQDQFILLTGSKGSISGMKFNDLNGNGIKDVGEPGLTNWTITLTNQTGGMITNITDVNGNYSFTNLADGNYTVGEVLQPGWIQTAPAVSANGTATYQVQISGGNAVTGKDFGNFQLGSVSGTKFNDLNGNGVRDPNELGLAGWNITINGTDIITGTTVTQTTTTDANGSYNFTGLTAGTYVISETLKPGWIQTAPAVSATGSATYTINITSGSNFTGKDFGNFKLGEIQGEKFNDINGNGKKDPADSGIANWQINIVGNDTLTGTSVNKTVTTNLTGFYDITNLTPGTYTIREIMQLGYIQTAPDVSTTGSATYNISISTSGQVETNKDFGNFQLGSVSGMKFEDLNANGVRDAGEAGLAGWNITINGTDIITGTTVNETRTTDANGNYNFTGLTAGTYTISETLKDGWVQTAPATGTYTVTITSGAVITGQDFGNFHKGKITGGGWIPALGAPTAKATFGIVGQYPDTSNTAQGSVEYQDHIAKLNIKSIQINTVATTLDKKKGVITGLAQVNGAGSYPFVVYVEDNAEPGKGMGVFKISLPTYPYSKGAILSGGNIQIHS